MCFFNHMQLKVSNMFKLGTSEAKINVTTWRGKVQIHVRKYFDMIRNYTPANKV